jgi:hypothetical protein
MTSEFEESYFSHQVPYNNIGILGTAGQSRARLVEGEACNCRFVTIETDYDSCNFRVPESDTAILISYGKYITVCLALCYSSNLRFATAISPTAQKLALLDIPTEHFFVGSSYCSTCAGVVR